MSQTIEKLPAGWAWVRLGEVCEFEYGKSLTKGNRSESGEYPVFGSNGIVGFHSEFLVEAPCIIVGRKGAAGEVHFSEKSCYPIDTTYFIKPNHLSPKFLFYQLKMMRLSELDRSTAIPGLNRNDAYQKNFALPPHPEQTRIVEKLESLLARLARAEQGLVAAETGLGRFRQSVLKAAFRAEDAEGKLKEGWRWVKVREVGEVVTGTTPSTKEPKFYGSNFPFFKPTDLEQGFKTVEARDFLSELGIKQARLLPEKSILVTCIGATIGKTGFSRKAGATNQQINAIVPNHLLFPEFGYFFAVSEFFQKQIKENASATTLPILNKSKFENLPFILPDLPTQTQIVQKIEHHLTHAHALGTAVQTARAECARLRQSILREAFAGRLVPQDAADEPAEVLLARLRHTTTSNSKRNKRNIS